MYQKENEKQFMELAGRLLQYAKEGQTAEAAEKTIDDLRTVINYNDWRYYVLSDPLLADIEYDQLFTLLKKLEAAHPELITNDSPTQRIAKGLTKEFPSVYHLVPMLSLDNSYNEADLADWDRKARELSGLDEIAYCVEPKFDGASISLIYENDHLVRGATRGDGLQGDDITVNIKQIKSIPLSAKFSEYHINTIEIRGEVLINKNTFEKFNEQRLADNLAPLANPRNAASGSLRMVNPADVKKRGLEAFLYHMSYYTLEDGQKEPKQIKTHYDTLKWFYNLGFRTPVKQIKVIKGIKGVIDYCHEFESKRDELPFEVDGLVVKVNDYQLQDKLGMTTHHPRWAMAFKFKARQATSVLRKVEFQVGRTGAITPVAKIDPVHIGGVTVGSISLFNEDVVREKDLHIGDTVLVERAGDVIPYIVRAQPELRDGTEEDIVFPEHCPVCGDPLVKPEDESVLRCINVNCEAQVVERMIHFVSKDAMDIRSLGESNVRKFYELGLLKDIPGIYHLDFDKIRQLEGFGEKSVSNLQQAIENSKRQPLHRLIFGLGIRYVGETTAKTLSHVVNHLLDLKDKSEEELLTLEDIGPKVAGAINQYFDLEDNIKVIEALEDAGVNMTQSTGGKNEQGGLAGFSFLFTGSLSHFKRSEAEALVEEHGGKIVSSVSSKLNYLIVGEDAGSKLEKAKRISSVKILSEQDFLKMMS